LKPDRQPKADGGCNAVQRLEGGHAPAGLQTGNVGLTGPGPFRNLRLSQARALPGRRESSPELPSDLKLIEVETSFGIGQKTLANLVM
jgi:hypothetical protein